MPIETPTPAASDLCCFCGQSVDDSGSERIRLSVRWLDAGREQSQSWVAHHTCLAERLHDSISGTGPF